MDFMILLVSCLFRVYLIRHLADMQHDFMVKFIYLKRGTMLMDVRFISIYGTHRIVKSTALFISTVAINTLPGLLWAEYWVSYESKNIQLHVWMWVLHDVYLLPK